MLIFFNDGSVSQLITAFNIAFVSLGILMIVRPYNGALDNALAIYAASSTLFTVFASLLLFVSIDETEAYNSAVLGATMVTVNVVVVVLAVCCFFIEMRDTFSTDETSTESPEATRESSEFQVENPLNDPRSSKDPETREVAQWEQYTDNNGHPYYYNTKTGESTYENPSKDEGEGRSYGEDEGKGEGSG